MALAPGAAQAYLSGLLVGGSNASTVASTLPRGGTPSAVASGNAVTISWTQNTVGAQTLGSYSGGGYTIQRYASTGGSPITPGSSCSTVVSGSATTLSCTESSVPPGRWYYKLTPVLNSWTGQQSAQSATLTIGASTDTVTSSGNPAPLGSVTYTATVTGAGATPTGSVTFQDGGTAISGCGTNGVVALSGGVATCKVSYATTGSHTITAPYAGDGNYNPAAGNSISQAVTQGASTDTVTSSAAPTTVGQAVTYKATLSGAGTTPTGTVTFMDGGLPMIGCGTAGVVSLSGGSATCTVTYASTASHTITAPYAGDSNYTAATGNTLTEKVNPGTATDSVASSQNPASMGSQVTYTATVSGAGVNPTGTVTFKDGGTAITGCGTGGVVSLTGGSATCAVTYATVGSHSITAAYSGDANYSTAAGNTLTQTVGYVSTTTVTSNYNPVALNAPVTYTATVAGSSGTPTGSVTFKDGGSVISSCGTSGVVALSAGVATCTVSYSAIAAHALTASYAGSTTYGPSASSALSQVVSVDANTLTQSAPTTNGNSGKYVFTGTASSSGTVTIDYCSGTVSSCTSSSSTYAGSMTATVSGTTWTSPSVTLTRNTAYTSQAFETDPLGGSLTSSVQQFTA